MNVSGVELGRALKIVRPAISRRKRGIFECVRLRSNADGTKLSVIADDRDTRIECVIDCDGSIDALVRYCELIPWVGDFKLLITDQSTGLLVASNDALAQLSTVSDDVAVKGLGDMPLQGGIILSRDELVDIYSLSPFYCRDYMRAVLNNICLNGSECAATDTHRLGVVNLNNDLGIVRFIPPSVIGFALASLPKSCKQLVMRWGDSRVQISTPDYSIRWTAYVDGANLNFPSYQRAISNEAETTCRITIAKGDLNKALTKMAAVADSNRVTISLQGSTLTLACKFPGGQASCELSATIQTFPEVLARMRDEHRPDWHCERISLNALYMLDALRFAKGCDEICIELIDPIQPLIIRTSGRTMVLMPMQTD